MAIKGKTKSRSARAVTRGPKPAYRPVRTPLLARRGLWLTVGVILGVAAIVGIAIGIVVDRNANEREERERALRSALAEYGRELEPILATVGEPQQPASWTSFSELGTALEQLEAGEGRPGAIEERGTTAASTAETAKLALEDVNASQIVRDRGIDETSIVYILNSREQLVSAFELFEQAGHLVAAAAVAEGAEREALVERARGVFDVARSLFDEGYADYVEAQQRAGSFDPTRLGSGIPPAGPTGTT